MKFGHKGWDLGLEADFGPQSLDLGFKVENRVLGVGFRAQSWD